MGEMNCGGRGRLTHFPERPSWIRRSRSLSIIRRIPVRWSAGAERYLRHTGVNSPRHTFGQVRWEALDSSIEEGLAILHKCEESMVNGRSLRFCSGDDAGISGGGLFDGILAGQ